MQFAQGVIEIGHIKTVINTCRNTAFHMLSYRHTQNYKKVQFLHHYSTTLYQQSPKLLRHVPDCIIDHLGL